MIKTGPGRGLGSRICYGKRDDVIVVEEADCSTCTYCSAKRLLTNSQNTSFSSMVVI